MSTVLKFQQTERTAEVVGECLHCFGDVAERLVPALPDGPIQVGDPPRPPRVDGYACVRCGATYASPPAILKEGVLQPCEVLRRLEHRFDQSSVPVLMDLWEKDPECFCSLALAGVPVGAAVWASELSEMCFLFWKLQQQPWDVLNDNGVTTVVANKAIVLTSDYVTVEEMRNFLAGLRGVSCASDNFEAKRSKVIAREVSRAEVIFKFEKPHKDSIWVQRRVGKLLVEE